VVIRELGGTNEGARGVGPRLWSGSGTWSSDGLCPFELSNFPRPPFGEDAWEGFTFFGVMGHLRGGGAKMVALLSSELRIGSPKVTVTELWGGITFAVHCQPMKR